MTLPTDPMIYIVTAGFAVTLALHVTLRGSRGLVWSAALGLGIPLMVWLTAVVFVLLKDGGASASSRFTIWGGLVMGVGMSVAFWAAGAIAAAVLVLIVRASGLLPRA